MTSIEANLLSDELIQFRTKKHLIIFFFPVIAVIISLYAYQYMHANSILTKVEWAPALIALIYFTSVWLDYITSQFVVTNKRIMMREGFFYRHSAELRINTISQMNVEQSLIGQIFDYGEISMSAFGAADTFTMIAHPLTFRKNANEQLDKATS
jgi:uncharacterized membrane protein YdbT with pleckstrin-like domain